LLLVSAPAADALTVQLPVGAAHGVRIVRDWHGAIVVVFTQRAARLWRRVAGRTVSVMCEQRSGPDEQGFVTVESGGTTFRAPRRGRRLRTGDLTRGMDSCTVSLEPRTVRRNGVRRHYPRVRIVDIPLTQQGAIRLDERERAYALARQLEIAGVISAQRRDKGYPKSTEFVALVPLLSRPLRLSVVELSSTADTPPDGAIGYYGDGSEHTAAVVRSATGRRLFLEYDADRVIRTNVIEYLLGDDE